MLRHGESEANAAGLTAGGGFDSPLNETGRGQAGALAEIIHSIGRRPEIVYHSSMSRARETASIVNRLLKLEMREDHHLREHDVGEWEGKPWAEISPRFARQENPPGGECALTFTRRVQGAMTRIFEAEARLPLLVAHGGVFNAVGMIYGHKVTRIANCHLHYFEPCADHDPFPWRVWQFDIVGAALIKNPAPFCLSQALSQSAR